MNFPLTTNTTVTKFDIEGKVIYAKIDWNENENNVFEIKIFDDVNSWSGCFTKECAEVCRKDVEESDEEYYKNVKMCLSSTCDMYMYEFTYKLEDEEVATFKWKKYYEGTATKLIHGSLDLRRDIITESKDILIDLLIKENIIQRRNIEESHKNIEALEIEIEKLKTELIKFVEIKVSLEDNLYGKFVSLLNTKKRRIQVLEDHLHKNESN